MKKILLVAAIGLLSLSIFAFGGNGYNTKGSTNTRGGYYQEDNFNQPQGGYNNRMPMNRNQMPVQRNAGRFEMNFRNAGENIIVNLELMIDKYSPELAEEFQAIHEELLQLREEQQIQLRTRDFSNEGPVQIRDRINNGLELREMYSELISEYQENDEEEIREILEKIVDTMKETIDNFETEEIE